MDDNKIVPFLVDDDALLIKSSEIEFADNTESVLQTYATGELCLESETAFILLQKTFTTIFHYQKLEKALS